MTRWQLIVWIGSIAVEIGAIYAIIWGVKYEVKHAASKGVIGITIGFGMALVGAFLFSKVLPFLR